MPRTLLEFFADEASDYLDKMDQALAVGPSPDADQLRRFARALRGSARMSDQDAIARAAGAVQGVAADLVAGRRHWGADLREKLGSALSEIRGMVDSVKSPPPDTGRRAELIAQQLGEAVAPPPPPKDDERFRRYLGTELRGLASDIGESLVVLERDPRNREPLKRLLRRIRPLRGIEGVDDIPAVGPAVTALEEVILRIADTSATVGPGHLVLFRRARQALDDVATELIRGDQPGSVVDSGLEIEDLKDQVLETAAQREITWISELFHDGPGPHIEACPVAERGAGSWEAFFALEATGSLDTIDRLRGELARTPEGAARLVERLTYTFRQLRERAVTFGHTELGRVARRAGAAVRATRDAPAWRLQAIAVDLAVTAAALRSYLESSEMAERDEALKRAEESLEAATHPAREPMVPIESLLYAPEDAVARARSLSNEAAGFLRVDEPDIGRAQHLLEEALGLIEHALSQAASVQ
ncbi:MAG: Hpt domain-containing protein [Gemmatimonadota bacterium]|nr:MAG: Hpt domain-containing protein [Gemmatimonadota bacterium]